MTCLKMQVKNGIHWPSSASKIFCPQKWGDVVVNIGHILHTNTYPFYDTRCIHKIYTHHLLRQIFGEKDMMERLTIPYIWCQIVWLEMHWNDMRVAIICIYYIDTMVEVNVSVYISSVWLQLYLYPSHEVNMFSVRTVVHSRRWGRAT